MTMHRRSRPLFDPPIVRRALWGSVLKFDPRHQLRNPVMFTVWACALLTTGLAIQRPPGEPHAGTGFVPAVAAWLWFTIFFANFAEAMAEGRGKAQADSEPTRL